MRTIVGVAGLALTLAMVAGGCGDDASAGDTSGDSAVGDTTVADSAVADAAVADSAVGDTSGDVAVGSCEAPRPDSPAVSAAIGAVQATLVDPDGAPLTAVPVSVCGTDLCLTGVTDAGGHASIAMNKTLVRPAFTAGDGRTVPELLWPLTAASADVGTLVAARLPSAGATLAPGGTAASGGVTLELAADAEVIVDSLSYPLPEDQALRAVALPVVQSSALVASTSGIGIIYGMGPTGTLVCPPAALSVPNSAGWAAGSEVEVLLLGADVGEDWAPYGAWSKVADAVVSADGTTVATTAGGGLPIIGTIALRPR